ncbi:MAG TPA: M14 family zinc carboxypeptidase [Thermoanaerobaculia bacterium]|jgi:hypothetical protein
MELSSRRAVSILVGLVLPLAVARAAEDPLFSSVGIASDYAPAQMDPRVPTPEKTLGFKIGDRFVTHADVSTYVRAVAAAAPERVRVETYGKTTEGRDLLLVVVTAPENHARFEELSGKIRSLYSPVSGKLTGVPSELPVFVWFSYGVHGDEASSPDAAMATLYHLAASRDADIAELLRRVVLTMDPMVNPDGRMRYLSWLATAVTGEPDPNPDAREHHPAWPRGRTNHFGFDLNRDWAWVTQAETRARIARYARTPPQVHVDYHEMSPESSYFFPPSAEPLHAGLHRDSVKWLGVFGRENASAFDARGWTYFVRETFDLFYPAYGDSWAFFNGAIGMTYEMAGGPGAGLAYRRRDGSILTLKERALKHFVTGLTTLATAAAHREELLRDFAAARAAPLASADRYYMIPGDQDAYRLRLFLETLRAQGIQVRRGKPTGRDDSGPLVIETAQPSGALAAALLDEKAELPEKFLEAERTKFLRREGEGFYDVTAWSLPAAFGLRASRMASRAPAGEDAELRPGRVEHSGARLGYLVRSPGLAAFPILARCAERHVVAAVAAKSFRLSGKNYAVGSLFLRREGAPAELDSIVAELARATGADFVGVDSAWTEEGIALGSERFVTWKPARVGLVTGPGVDRSSSGWATDEFYRVFRYPVSLLDVDSFDDAELDRYNVLILPDAASKVTASLAKSNAEALRAWVKAGGVLVGIGGGAALLREKDVDLSHASEWKPPREKESEKKPETAPAEKKKSAAEPKPADEADIENRRIRIPGAIFRTRAKPEHFLLFGSPEPPRVLLATDAPLIAPADPFETVVSIERDKPLASGHAWPEAIERMAGTPYLIAEPAGKGWAITFLDDPNFRGFWLGTSLLFGNAAILAPSFTP